jgi:hypothetical protein
MMVTVAAGCTDVALGGVPGYAAVGSFDLPANVSAFDVLPDGRLITFVVNDFWVQDAVNGSEWSRSGSLAPGVISSFGASFVRVSPDVSTIAIGDNRFGPAAAVHTLPFGSLDPLTPSGTIVWPAANLDAHWSDADTLYVAGATTTGEVREIDLGASSSRLVVSNIGLSAGGLTSDGVHLFAGNGFDLGGGSSSTGEVRAFEWSAITAASSPVDFASGIPVADALSGASLDFDLFGNLFIGGGDVFGGSGDVGYAAAVDAGAVQAALLGGPAAPDSSEQRLTPLSPDHSYFTRFNRATNELLVTFFDNTSFEPGATVFRYAVPTPGTVVIGAIAIAARRRRSDTEGTAGREGRS